MELQWPLIIFTTLVSWCAGTFATQAYLALKGTVQKAQIRCWIVSAVLLVVGGIAVFFHLQHWERIFNGFGHITSGITQELIAIIVLAIVAVIYLAMLRKNEGSVPKWVAILAIVMSAVLVVVMGHSYMMEARPAWCNVLWIVSLLGVACILGPATVAVVCETVGEDASELGMPAFIGSIINAVASLAAALMINTTHVSEVGNYYDLTHPMKDITASGLNIFGGESLIPTLLMIVLGCAAPIACAYMGKKTGNWKVYGTAAVVCAAIGAVCLRAVFYLAGASVFGIY